jgi:hypothetical protein
VCYPSSINAAAAADAAAAAAAIAGSPCAGSGRSATLPQPPKEEGVQWGTQELLLVCGGGFRVATMLKG